MTDEKNILQVLLEFLPKKLATLYTPEKILTINRHNTILMLSSKETENKFVLKILEKTYYDTMLFELLNTLSDTNLLLPLQTDFDSSYIYLLYPLRKTLSEALQLEELDYPVIYRFIHEIGNAILSLHKHNILHLDITPDNIFLDEKNHFFLGDFSSSRLVKRSLLSRPFHSCLHTGTTPAFAPQNKNDNSISFWNDQYSFALLLYILFNNGNLPAKENQQKHSFFPSVNHILLKAMNTPSVISKEMFSHFLSELEKSLKKDEQLSDCKNYQIQWNESNEIICKSSTPDCTMQKEIKTKIQTGFTKNQLQIPVPLYGLLMCCGFLFLFSLYHYMAQNKANTTNKYHLQAASLSSSDDIKNTTIPTISSETPKTTPSNSIEPLTQPDNGHSKKNSENTLNFPNKNKVLNISNSVYFDNTFLNSSMQPENILILFANSCQFMDSASFSDFTNLQELYLYDNPLSSVTALSKINHLKTLVLSKCKLNDISCLANLKNLRILDLSQNKHLKGIKSLSSLKKLNYLIVTHTNISQEELHFLQKRLPHCTILF